MADYSGPPPPPPPMMHTGRIPNYRNNHGENFQNRCGAEPPACVQNAMMTKDKKPFTYTPGGLDLSQIRTPSMARRLNKQQQQMEDQENPAYFQRPVNGGGGGPPPPPLPPTGCPPPPPPPPPLVINVSKSPKPTSEGERPEIVIPENPIGMLRKTNSPYHWESEQSDRIQGPMPKFVNQSSPQMRVPPPKQFSQQPPPHTPPTSQYENHNNKSASTSPIWKPEPKYPNSPNASPQIYQQKSPAPQGQTKDMLQRQDSQFNLSPSPWNHDSPSNSSSKQTMSPSSDTMTSSRQSNTPMSNASSPWRQDMRSPYQNNNVENSPVREMRNMSLQQQSPKSPLSPQQTARGPSPYDNVPQPIYNNVNRQTPEVPQRNMEQENVAPWRQNSQTFSPKIQQNCPLSPVPVYNPSPQPSQYSPQYTQNSPNGDANSEVRYQTHMTIPVTPRKLKNEPNAVQHEPLFSPKIAESPKDKIPWARNDANKSAQQPAWYQKPSESRKGVEVFPQSEASTPVQPPWYQKPGEMPQSPLGSWMQHDPAGALRVIPIQMEVSKKEVMQNNGNVQGRAQPQLRIIIDMNQQGKQQGQNQSPQQITRVIQPQIVRMDGGSGMASPQQNVPQVAQQQPRTRIIPIQMEPPSPGVTSPRVLNHQISQEFQPRQSRAFRVLQAITGTEQDDPIEGLEYQNGYTDL